MTDQIFSLCLVLSNRLAADLLEQRWRSPVAQVGGKRVFFKAHWEQHVRNERQGAPAADQRGFPLPISSFRWESGSRVGSAWKIWPVVGLCRTHPEAVLSTEDLMGTNTMTAYEKEDLLALASVWGRGGFQIKETIRLEVIHLWADTGTLRGLVSHQIAKKNSILRLLSALPMILKTLEETAKSTYAVNRSVKNTGDPGMVVHTCNPTTQEVKAGGSWIQSQPGLHKKTLYLK